MSEHGKKKTMTFSDATADTGATYDDWAMVVRSMEEVAKHANDFREVVVFSKEDIDKGADTVSEVAVMTQGVKSQITGGVHAILEEGLDGVEKDVTDGITNTVDANVIRGISAVTKITAIATEANKVFSKGVKVFDVLGMSKEAAVCQKARSILETISGCLMKACSALTRMCKFTGAESKNVGEVTQKVKDLQQAVTQEVDSKNENKPSDT